MSESNTATEAPKDIQDEIAAKTLDGSKLAQEIQAGLLPEISLVKEALGLVPGLAVILVGDNAASKIYVGHKEKACAKVGIKSFHYELPASTTEQYVLELIDQLNANREVHGILVQLPLPKHIDPQKVIMAIDPEKDADGFHPMNLGKLLADLPGAVVPCTPAGCLKLIDKSGMILEGKTAIVIGRSTIVGKPMAHLLLKRNATVTMCHSKTKGLAKITKAADVIVVAVGKPRTLTGDMVKAGTVVIDVGMNRLDNGALCGDVDFETVAPIVKSITPVPKGVGPMTIAMLLKNTVELAKRQIPS